jgi:AIPR protein
MAKQKFSFPAPISRRAPDPVFRDISRHILFVPVRGVPRGIPFEPNARIPNLNRRVYRDLKSSLINDGVQEDGMFHLKHKGITLVAEKVEQKSGGEEFIVTMANGHGVLDGGHTYELITSMSPDNLPEQQFVKFEILTNVPEEWIADIAGGLNTSVQVQPMSLDNLRGDFEWIKNELEGEEYFHKIAWKENEDGESDARDLISLLTLFNIDLFPNTGDAQPVVAYEKKSKALQLFEENADSYKKLRPMLKEILILHDTIRRDSRDHWNDTGGQFGKFKFVEERDKGEFEFPFTGERAKYRLTNGALYPMLGAFRWMVENGKGKNFRWRGGFQRVIERWDGSAEELVRATAQANTELGRNPNAIGKSRNHWANLHARVAMRDLMAQK